MWPCASWLLGKNNLHMTLCLYVICSESFFFPKKILIFEVSMSLLSETAQKESKNGFSKKAHMQINLL